MTVLPATRKSPRRSVAEAHERAAPGSPLILEIAKGRVEIGARRVTRFCKLIDSLVIQSPTDDRLRRSRGGCCFESRDQMSEVERFDKRRRPREPEGPISGRII